MVTTCKIIKACLNYVLPAHCILCNLNTHSSSNMCQGCFNDLPILPESCKRCGNFLPQAALYCGYCLNNNPKFARTHALFPYLAPIKELIARLKYDGDLTIANWFAECFLNNIDSWYQTALLPDLIVPVPLHVKRLKARGFNQSIEIAKIIARKLKIPLDKNGIVRIKNTLPQSQLQGLKRQQNLQNAFATEKNFSNLSVAIFDDVLTTGATLTALSDTIMTAGAKEISIWVCARKS